ncbi:Lrp/AsnC family transcriptional regulator [Picrophilus oshimae]|uniref:Transcriptional regulator, AsnC family n=1 Tax=Picrophilus torridus (strain ATCC 700027 / DSM 9790 / JCM 10055 / NBRC 100828 / KAW 2/3) TaxID=1122961 RepID=Q6KZR6_PICTO|nr:Lrp/AsnC family transcriptional regulator [Picrophilus oshimae]AAT43786.1 transcriptional regulatory protein, AsnC family [Picrophilus oshimae DSM 9789]SMD31147.1 transcriptional regulator, AsnC family [Picrophilus oshimae DSM 9789]
MDDKDKKIIEMLIKNSRTSNMDIARQLNVSEGTIRKRIEKLVNDGIITKFTIETTSSVDAIVLIKVDPSLAGSVIKTLKAEYNDIYEYSGSVDIAVRLRCTSLDELNSEVDSIRNIHGVINTDTLIRLK